MTNYQFLNDYPYYPCSDSEGFQLRDCMIYRMRGNQEVESWDMDSAAPADFPSGWYRQFWTDLRAAPAFELRADQWSTDYYAVLGGYVVRWRDDRKEGAYFIERGIPCERFLGDVMAGNDAKEWFRKIQPPS